MVNKVEIINKPYSGQYKEKIYDNPNPWNSSEWTWVKFTNDDFSEWCGVFRGEAKNAVISDKYNTILVLTSDYLYQMDKTEGELMEFEENLQYQNITVTPLGDFIISDYSTIELIKSTIKQRELINSPINMDMIEFIGWSNNKLLIKCESYLNLDKIIELELNCENMKITCKK